MKASILKKFNAIMEEANAFKDKNKFQKAITKFREAISYLHQNVKNLEDKKTEIENVRNAINQTYSLQIDNTIQEATDLSDRKEFIKAKDKLREALTIANKIDDSEFKNGEISEIQNFSIENDIKQILEDGLKLREEKRFDDALKLFNKGLNLAADVCDSESKDNQIALLNKEINVTYNFKITSLVKKGTELKKKGQIEEALSTFDNVFAFINEVFDNRAKSTEVKTIKNLTNEIYSNKIKPIIENAKDLIERNLVTQAISELKKAHAIANKMHDSDLKKLEVSQIAEIVNPIYLEQITPIIEKGKQITQQDKFEESLIKINEAVNIFNEALSITKNMVNSERKERMINEVTDLINQACLAGINVIKDNSIQYIVQKNYEEAISELYIALSIAKKMIYPEDENPEIENLKNVVNKVYSAEVQEVVKKGNKLVDQKEFNRAIDVFNDALAITNKMYLTDEMEKEVSTIKSLIYEAEVKELIGKGKLTEEQKLKEKEIEKLTKRLEYANSIDDPDRRIKEMTKIKKLIDSVYSEEIGLLVEQGNQLADIKEFNNAFEFYEKALKVNDMMEEPDVKNKDLIKNTYKKELVNKAKSEIENQHYDIAIENCLKAIKLDEKFVDAYYHIGIAYKNKRSYDNAIEYFQRTVGFDKNHIHAWNLMGLSYEAKKDYDNALIFLSKCVEIDPTFAEAWYNMGNVYKQTKRFDKAIENYNKATELEPEFAKAWFLLGTSYFDINDYNNKKAPRSFIRKIYE